MDWGEIVEAVRPHVVKIETPTVYGTGFLAFYSADGAWCGIATAAHVVSHADTWQEPIRIVSEESETPRFLKADERVIYLDHSSDSAVVLFFKSNLNLPQSPIALLPMNEPCSIGTDVGWLGYPMIEPFTLCFFAGTVSAQQVHRRAYLIDGVAINGVSGGPVFHCPSQGRIQIIGAVSAYHANRATGEALPGLLRALDVSHFHGVAGHVKTAEEAIASKKEFESATTAVETSDVGPISEIDWGFPRVERDSGDTTPTGA